MGFVRWFLGLSCAVVLLYLYLGFAHPHQRTPDHAFFDAPGPWAIAHQGGRGLWPENTLFAFEQSRALGVDVLEMDLRGTADGHIVVMHDETVDRTTEGNGRVAEMSFAEMRALNAAYRFRDEAGRFPFRERGLQVPEIREVLSEFRDSRLIVEMKQFTAELAVSLCTLLREYRAEDRVVVASFGHTPMAAFRGACPAVATSATLREGLAFYQLNRLHLGSLYRSPAVVFQVPENFGDRRVVEPAFLELADAFNMPVQVWTVNEEDDMKRLLDMGVQGIMTDYPDRLLRQMGRSLDVAR